LNGFEGDLSTTRLATKYEDQKILAVIQQDGTMSVKKTACRLQITYKRVWLAVQRHFAKWDSKLCRCRLCQAEGIGKK